MVTLTPGIDFFNLNFTPSSEIDVIGYKVHMVPSSSLVSGNFTPTEGNLVNKGPETNLTIPVPYEDIWCVKIAAYDVFGEDNLNYSQVYSVSVTGHSDLTSQLDAADFFVRNSIFYFTGSTLNWTEGYIDKGPHVYSLASGTISMATAGYVVASFNDSDYTVGLGVDPISAGVPSVGSLQKVIGITSAIPLPNGVYVCYIRQANSVQYEGALIRDATITDAKITGTLSANKITTLNGSTSISGQGITVLGISNTANTAAGNASTALTNAATANTNASAAVSTANTAASNASTAITNAASALSAAAAAQSTADTAAGNATTAITNAATANTLLADLASDSKLTPIEKTLTQKEWDVIVSEKPTVVLQAGTYSLSTVSYVSAYNALSTYITPLLADLTTTTTIVGSTFRTNFKNYYDARTLLLKAISDNAKTLAADAQTDADTAIANAATAQSAADTASANAATAQSSADTANTLLADISSDSKLTALEKQLIKKEWDTIVSEKSAIDSQADSYSVPKTTYGTNYTTLSSYLTSLLADITTTSDITGATLRTNFKNYYDARTAILNSIANETAKKALWASVSGAGKPADNATVGAPAGTTVAGVDAATLVTTANTAAGNASTALTNAATANALLADLASDSKLTAVEKQMVKKEWDVIVAEKATVDGQADTYAISRITYDNNYTTLSSYITPLLSDLTSTSDIVATTFRTNFKNYYDSKTSLLKAISDSAQSQVTAASSTATTAASNASTAITNAATAQTSANTANTLLADIASDDKFTPVEKSSVRGEWDIIASEKSTNNTQAATFSVTTENTTYNTKFQALADYLNNGSAWSSGVPSWISDANLSATTTITGATFRTKFKDYYDARTALLTAIAAKAKTLADAAQAAADTASTNASAAQSTANTASTNASTALTNAAAAQTSANTANSLLTDIASDSKLTAIEKQLVKKEWDIVVSEKSVIDAQADVYGASRSYYDSYYGTLSTYITPLLSDLAATSDITGSFFRTKFKDYYDARTALLKVISDSAKSLADAAQSTADTANTNATSAQGAASTAITNAATAQSTADTAITNAATANSLLTDIASDSKLTPLEKSSVRGEWDVIVAEKSVNNTQATTFSITTENTTYNTKFQALADYLNNGSAWTSGIPSWISDANLSSTTTIVGATFRTKFKDYYDARTAMLNAIAGKAKTLADAAQSTATTAAGNAATAITNAATAQSTADSAATNASTAITNAATAQSTATTAATNASTAITNAATANSLLTDIASDSKLTAVEKQLVKKEWDAIVSEKTTLDTQADLYSVSRTNYDSYYGTLSTYITSLLSDLTTTSDITGTFFRTKFKDYYDTRTALLNAIANETARRAVWSAITSIPSRLGDNDSPGVAGLYLTANHMGYHNGTTWTSYVDNTGKFYFKGDASNYIDWNISAANTLTIRGKITADDITAGGTITGSTLRTASSGQRFTVDNVTGGSSFYDPDGNEQIYIGIAASSGQSAWGAFGIGPISSGTINTHGTPLNVPDIMGIQAYSYSSYGGYFQTHNGDCAIRGTAGYNSAGSTADGIQGAALWEGYGVYGTSGRGIGIYGWGYTHGAEFGLGSEGTVLLTPAATSSAPTHTARIGTLYVTSTGVLYINTSGSTTWTKVGAQ